MMNKKDIIPTNEADQRHGWCERYFDDDELAWRGIMFNGDEAGYHKAVYDEWAGYFLEGNKISEENEDGYCYIWKRVEL